MITRMFKGKPMVEQTDGIIQGWIPAVTTENVTPSLHFNGADFPRKLYLQTVAFAKWCMDEYGGEVQGRLYYNENSDKWAVAILPQWMSTGLHSVEIEDHEDRATALAHVSTEGWVQNGTWHSHAYAMAGQSSTDLKDELKQPGFHYTVGSLRDKKASFHSRYSFRGLMYTLDDGSILKRSDAFVAKCKSFPAEWRDSLHKKPVREYNTDCFKHRNSYGYGYWDSASGWTKFDDKPVEEADEGIITYMGQSFRKREFVAFKSSPVGRDIMKVELMTGRKITADWLTFYRRSPVYAMHDTIPDVLKTVKFGVRTHEQPAKEDSISDDYDKDLVLFVSEKTAITTKDTEALFDIITTSLGYEDVSEAIDWLFSVISEHADITEQMDLEDSWGFNNHAGV